MASETSMGGSETRFRSTLWETIRDAQGGSEAALARLVESYWKPVYFFLRRRGQDVERAKDLTQSYFAAFVEKDFLKGVSSDRGRFRSFVMTSVSHHMADARDKAQAQKRGGGFNFVQAEADLVVTDESPERAFYKGWALALLENALNRVRAECSPEDVELLAGKDVPGLEGSEKKNRLHRLRVRIREELRESLRDSVDTESDIDGEINAIFEALG